VEIVIVALAALVVAGVVGLAWSRRRRRKSGEDVEGAQRQQYAEERFHQLKAIAERDQWTEAAFDVVLEGRIDVGMTQDMVLLAWGGPAVVDSRQTDPRGRSVERWVYRNLDGATWHVWFVEGRVFRVQQ